MSNENRKTPEMYNIEYGQIYTLEQLGIIPEISYLLSGLAEFQPLSYNFHLQIDLLLPDGILVKSQVKH